MANLASNPWSFTSTDPATAAITAVTGLTLNADGTVTVTSAALTFNTAGVPPAQWFTIIGAGDAHYNGFYRLIAGVSGGITFTLVPQFSIPAGTAQNGNGTIAQCLYPFNVRVDDLSWQKPAAAADNIDYRDRNGNIIWQAVFNGTTAPNQNRGKIFWVEGVTPIVHSSGVLLMTVD